ncbi:hypothetical protein FIV39_06060 [Pseudomonas grimontii]|uniref:Uncharacterized protein n=1 Tax=Pseudomonas grimontii TaxID=129847 RepID=A0A5C5PSF3_9PSED|nr:hypothetical protein FIV39_06060 [Pseudomonas grimontii]
MVEQVGHGTLGRGKGAQINLTNTANPLWEGACSRSRWVSQPMYRLIHRNREQAPSHILIAFSHSYWGDAADPRSSGIRH